jgi:hypothetical protein
VLSVWMVFRFEGLVNQHLATYPNGQGLKALWITQQVSQADELAHELHGTPLPQGRKLEMPFARTCMGICFEPLFLCVVGERKFHHTPSDRSESVYVVLDEILETTIPAELFRQAIELKDQYRISHIFAPTMPGSLAETLRRTEGLTHYSDRNEHIARERWSSFVDFDCVSGVILTDAPNDQALTSEVNGFLQSEAVDPKTQTPMRGTDGEALPKLLFLDDMPMLRTLQSVRTGNLGGSLALWNAVRGLEHTRLLVQEHDSEEHIAMREGNSITGY